MGNMISRDKVWLVGRLMGKTLRGMNLSPGLPLSINWLPSLDDVEDTAGLEGTHILLFSLNPNS